MQLSRNGFFNRTLDQFKLPICRKFTKNLWHRTSRKSYSIKERSSSKRGIISEHDWFLLYLSHRSRPDISLAVGVLSQYSSKPTKFLLKSVHRLFEYLKSTNHGLKFDLNFKDLNVLNFFCVADFGGNRITRKSRSGWVEKCFWFLFLRNKRKQNFVS